jgi:flagellar hook-associated protein 1 FlgK
MLGLFGTLNMASRSMQAQQAGIEVAGHNLANVNNPGYARQRVNVQTSASIDTEHGIEGTGVSISGIVQIRSALLDGQIVSEGSVTGSLEALQQALQYAQSNLGQQIDRNASGAAGASAASGTGKQHGIGESLSDLFSSFQSLSTQPSSITERDIVLTKANALAEKFRQTDARLDSLRSSLNDQVSGDIGEVNGLLENIAQLNKQIGNAESLSSSTANDMRDTRQAKLEALAKLVKFDAIPGEGSAVNISIGGVTMVDGISVRDRLEGFEAPGGKLMVRAAAAQTDLDITGGSIHGAIDARDGAVQSMRGDLSKLAATLITEINNAHMGGVGLDGSTGADFFTGTGAADMKLNSALTATNLQASSTGEAGNNDIILAMAKLEREPQTALGNQTFSGTYSGIVANLGDALSNVNQQVTDQNVVANMLKQQRDSVSAVSMDEEMTDLMKFQKAYQASARIVNVVNEMLDTVINMAR